MKKPLITFAAAIVALACFAGGFPAPHNQVVGDTTFVPYRVGSSAPTKLYTVLGYNSGPAQFIMIFENGNAPTNGQVGKFAFPIASQNYYSFDLSYYGADLNAISVCNSTTAGTNTLGSTNCSFQVIIAQ